VDLLVDQVPKFDHDISGILSSRTMSTVKKKILNISH